MLFVFSSSNPETIEQFRTTYYKPKLGLWLLLFILFPPIDRTPPQTDLSPALPAEVLPAAEPPAHPACPDAYRDHRNNLICPHAPKRLKSVRQRFSQVLLELQSSCQRLVSPQDQHAPLAHQQPHRWPSQIKSEQQQQQQQQQQQRQQQQLPPESTTTISTLSSLPRLIVCAPLANPFLHLLIILHILLVIQMVSLLIEDALIKDACLSAPSTSFRRPSAGRPGPSSSSRPSRPHSPSSSPHSTSCPNGSSPSCSPSPPGSPVAAVTPSAEEPPRAAEHNV